MIQDEENIVPLSSSSPAPGDGALKPFRRSIEGRKMKVLVVEDNEVNRVVLSTALRRMGCDVNEAANGAEGLEKAEDSSVDLALMDVHMPVLDGITAASLMKQRGIGIPIVFVTADITEQTRSKCLGSGAFAVLHKPLKLAQLENILQQLIRSPVKHCLIVDDVETNRVLAGHVLRKLFGPDAEIVYAKDGLEAVEAVEHSKPFDLILMDCKMPNLNGFDATRIIREKGFRDVRIIGITAGDEDDKDIFPLCRNAGMDSVVMKPLREDLLRSALVKKNEVVFDESFVEDLDEETKSQIIGMWKVRDTYVVDCVLLFLFFSLFYRKPLSIPLLKCASAVRKGTGKLLSRLHMRQKVPPLRLAQAKLAPF